MKKKSKLVVGIILLFIILAVAVAIDFLLLEHTNYFALIILLVAFIGIASLYFIFSKYRLLLTDDIEKNLNSSMNDALSIGEMGILVYNEDYEITWLSSIFARKDLNKVGEKVLVWLPELQDLLSGRYERTIVIINDDKYEVRKKDDAYVLYFKDITKEYDLEEENKNQAYVLGLVNFDNFDDSSLNEDEIAFINTNIKVPVLEYLRSYGVIYKTLRNNRLQLILNYQIYQNLLDDRFSIINKIKRESKTKDIDITLSVAFAFGSKDLNELDDEVSNLIEVAETRGGDQVVVREIGKEVIYFGGSSEAKERASKVKVRVVANTLRRMIEDASNVIIVGHKDADSDCVGASLAMSIIVQELGKEAYIALRSNQVEPMINDVMKKYQSVIGQKHVLVTGAEALSKLDKDTLVVMVDHHSKENSNSESILDEAKNIIIIDHHRRKADLDVDAKFLYVEAGASSTTELMVELFPYFSNNIDIKSEEANIMYIGLLIDTNHFRNRTDARTFDVAKTLKQFGANSIECEMLIEEPYEMSKKRYEIIALGKRYDNDIMIANCEKGTYPRSIASQAVDMMVGIKEIDAAFVICKISATECAISARSNGTINVQMILEKMGGGGHLTAAGLQTKEKDTNQLYNDLTKAIDEYLESVKDNESNIIN